ncbi:glycosyltransferase [Sorangium sp. So ce1078]|uniref:glycosyltransferase n=1 Tax=Sorangium sp. So ce1078 TaxID=3133329 RepID=UPI003F619CF5
MTPFNAAPWPPEYLRSFQRRDSYRFVALTWGTRGDVQPFVTLGAELMRRGHRFTIAARAPFRSFVEERGIGFFEMEDDGTDALMHAMANSGGGARGIKLFFEAQRRLIRPQFRQLWQASEGADVLVSNAAYTVPAPHIAEKRGVPLVQVFLDPVFVPTRAYGFYDDRVKDRGALANLVSTRVRNHLAGLLTLDAVIAWRREHGLGWPRRVELAAPALVFNMPVFAAWSTALLPRPSDWPASIVQTGRWPWSVAERVSPALADFMAKGPAPIYLGFGSWGVHDKVALTQAILEALRVTGNRAVLHRNTVDASVAFPDHVYVDDELPHEWLFPRVKAVVHHGGAGTAGAAAAAGVPSVVIPASFGQVSWGGIVSERGCGTLLMRSELSAATLAAAIQKVDAPDVRERAREIGERARAEGGVTLAAGEIEWQLSRAAR